MIMDNEKSVLELTAKPLYFKLKQVYNKIYGMHEYHQWESQTI